MAIKGEILMSIELENMQEDIQNNKFPRIWGQYSYPNLKPLYSWLEDFNQRVSYMLNWHMNGIPKTMWLTVFFFPQGFLTTVL